MSKHERPRILIADDDPSFRRVLAVALKRGDYDVTACSDGDEAIALLSGQSFDCIVSDLRMPGRGGLDVLRAARQSCPDTPVILMSGDPDVPEAVDAIKEGAQDFLVKPFDICVFEARIRRAVNWGERQETTKAAGNDLIAESQAMRRILALAERVADSRATVLLVGESGTGKERVARYVHEVSDRRNGPFVALNCAAIPENLLESELFGHEKGAFSGADRRRIGKFEAAQGGTLLLDEISEMDLGLQAKLLRVLQEFEVDRVGGSRPVPIDVRVICTTNQDLRQMVDEGRFREDLYYRIHVFPLRLPPLRERPEEIEALAHHFVQRHAASNRRLVKGLTPEAVASLKTRRWQGNVRELANTLERAVLLCAGEWVEIEDLMLPGSEALDHATDVGWLPREPADDNALCLDGRTTLAELERQFILLTLDSTGGNRTHTSRRLGISIRTLRNRLRAYKADGFSVHPPALGV